MMNIEKENLYRTILDLHYIRNTLVNHQDLERSADYIEKKFEEFGLNIESQMFKIEELEEPFRNIIGTYNPGKERELLITAHYDHIQNSVGADDNLSGVAVLLEVARIISTLKLNITVKFIAFTLEEYHAGFIKLIDEKLETLGLTDKDGNPTSYKNSKFLHSIQSEITQSLYEGKPLPNKVLQLIEKYSGDYTEKQLEYLEFRRELYERQEKIDPDFHGGLAGSYQYVMDNKNSLKRAIGVINMDTIGFTAKQEYSQRIPKGLDLDKFPRNAVKNMTIGDFITIIADKNSSGLAQIIFDQAIDTVPSLLVALPFNFTEIRVKARDFLRSDHAPFWKANIPAVFLTDTGNFRNPYYHTPADTIDKLDFEFLEKITSVLLETAIKIGS